MIRIAIFASGSGTNAENLVRYFKGSDLAQIGCILTNNPEAGVLRRARSMNIPGKIFNKKELNDGTVAKFLEEQRIGFIILAGFLLLIPSDIIRRYPRRIVNIHPALLPLHGGKGFYGEYVHRAVIDSGAIMSGISVHLVNEAFDEGEVVFQAGCHVSKEETPPTLAEKIHALEYSYFPVVVEKLLKNLALDAQ